MKKLLFVLSFPLVALLAFWLYTGGASAGRSANTAAPPGPHEVFVSIAPLKYLAEQIGGPRIRVTVMVPPGADPHLFDPSPVQMQKLSASALFFMVGDPAETAWVEKVRDAYPGVSFIRLDQGIAKKTFDNGHNHGGADDHGDDPHIWLSLKKAAAIAKNMTAAIIGLEPSYAAHYENNLAALTERLDTADGRIAGILSLYKGRRFITVHPSWGYFAEDYGLVQTAVEESGKRPSAAHLVRVVETMRREKVTTVFTSPQFPMAGIEALLEQTGAQAVPIDPLAEDIPRNLRAVAEAIAASFAERRP